MTDKYGIEIRYVEGWQRETLSGSRTSGIVIGWRAITIGFGELTVSYDGKVLECDSELMSQEFCEAVLEALAKSWKMKDDK